MEEKRPETGPRFRAGAENIDDSQFASRNAVFELEFLAIDGVAVVVGGQRKS